MDGNAQVTAVCEAVCTRQVAAATMILGGATPKSLPTNVMLLPPVRTHSVTTLASAVVAQPTTADTFGSLYDTAFGTICLALPEVTVKGNCTPDPAGNWNVKAVKFTVSVTKTSCDGTAVVPTVTVSGGKRFKPETDMVKPPWLGQYGDCTSTPDESGPMA